MPTRPKNLEADALAFLDDVIFRVVIFRNDFFFFEVRAEPLPSTFIRLRACAPFSRVRGQLYLSALSFLTRRY